MDGFRFYVPKNLLKQFTDTSDRIRNSQPTNISIVDKEIDSLSLKIPYMGAVGEKLVKTLKRKV